MEQTGTIGCPWERELSSQRKEAGETFNCTFFEPKESICYLRKKKLIRSEIFGILERFVFFVQLSLYGVTLGVGGNYILHEAWGEKEAVLERRLKQTSREDRLER